VARAAIDRTLSSRRVVPKTPPLLVTKLGGSLAGSRELTAWLAALDRYGGPLILVPGGGAFAETVRDMQSKMRCDDAAAHHMALLAMEQYGVALAALWPRLSCAATPGTIRRVLRLKQVACWAPTPMVLDSDLPRTWEVTSDTLSAWLAKKLDAKKLLLIKSADTGSKLHVGVAELVNTGMVDPLFPRYAARGSEEIFIAGPSWLASAASLLGQGQVPGTRVRLA
jgi:5-(aminomethyl)-3-furanmethanol phosphate kinase